MVDDKLYIDTEHSLYKPITININGKDYTLKRINRKVLRELGKFEKAALMGDAEAPYKQLEFLIGEHPIIDELSTQEVAGICRHITRKAFSPEQIEEAEKNGSEPGDKK